MKDSCNVLHMELNIKDNKNIEEKYNEYVKKYAIKHKITEQEAKTHQLVKNYYDNIKGGT